MKRIMRKTLIAYILTCIEEIDDLEKLGQQVRELHEVLFQEIEKNPDDLLNILFLYTIIFETDFQLGLEIKSLYNEIKYFFDEYTTDIRTNSN